MSKNHMREVSKLLGIKLGEEFTLVPDDSLLPNTLYRLMPTGMEAKPVGYDFHSDNTFLVGLLNGTYKAERKPWMPQEDELYHYIRIDVEGIPSVFKKRFINSMQDKTNILLGNFFRNHSEADEKIQERFCKYINELAKIPDMGWRNEEDNTENGR